MCSRWLALALAGAGVAQAQSRPATPVASGRATSEIQSDSLSALRDRYSAEMRTLIPKWRAAERAVVVADSLAAASLPPDTIRAGALLWLIDASKSSVIPEAVARSWSDLYSVFGDETAVLRSHRFVAVIRKQGGKDTTRMVIDLAQVHPGRLDIFDRVNGDESVAGTASRISAQSAKIILQNGDSTVLRWLIDTFNPEPLLAGIRERMYADLVTAPSQVSSRCLAGDLRRCRDALGLLPTVDPLTEWYDAPERRLLVIHMRELLNVGPQMAPFRECAELNRYTVCDRILRTIPRYVVPPALPTSARHHLFRIAMQSGGSGAYSRLFGVRNGSVEDRLAAAARVPIDSVVAQWRADVIAAHPPSPTPSLLSAWTAVAWGIAVVLVALRFAAWR